MKNSKQTNNNPFTISDKDLKSYMIKDFEYCREYEKNLIDMAPENPDVIDLGLIEWVMEHFIDDNNLDYDTDWSSYVKRGRKLFNVKYEKPKGISKEVKEKFYKEMEALGYDTSKF